MKIAYLTIEDITSGLFKTQILDIIEEISNYDNTVNFKIYILNRPWLYFRHRVFLNEYRAKYNSNNISFCYIPLLPPLRNSLKFDIKEVSRRSEAKIVKIRNLVTLNGS
jgi:hypothetical protein